MEGALWRFAAVGPRAAATGVPGGVAALIGGWYSALDAKIELPARCVGAVGAVLHFDEESETLLCADGGPLGSRLWACCLATLEFALKELTVAPRAVFGGACYAVDTRSVEVLVDRGIDTRNAVMERWSIDVCTGTMIGELDDAESLRFNGERGLGLVGGERFSYFLGNGLIFPESGRHSAIFVGSPARRFQAFAAIADDRGDIWMGVDADGHEPSILWLARPATGARSFCEKRRVRHHAIHRGVCLARHRDAALVLDGARLSLLPFAALRALPAILDPATPRPPRNLLIARAPFHPLIAVAHPPSG